MREHGHLQALGAWLGLDRARLAYALRLAFAAWSSYALASLLHLPNAYWAGMPAWVVVQPSRGLMLERGVFRVVGTLLGAAVGLALLHLPLSPVLQLALLAAWIGLNAGLTQLLRGVHGYGALLAGMTAAIVVLPSLLAPGQTLRLALSRVACTVLGVVVVTLVMGLFTPASARQEFYQRVRELSGHAVAFAAAQLEGRDVPDAERRLLREISEVESAARLVTAGSVEGYRRLKHVEALVAASLSAMAAGRGLGARQRRGEGAYESLAPPLRMLAARLQAPGVLAAVPLPSGDARLEEALGALIQAEAALVQSPARADARSFGAKATLLAPHVHWSRAWRTGARSGGACFAAALLGLASGRPEGALLALGVCIFSMVLGSLPSPHRVAPVLLKGVLAGVIVATAYRLLVQPHVTTLPGLLLSVAPFIFVGGLARASPRTAGPALDANMCFLLASQAVLPPPPPHGILAGAAALLLAAALVAFSHVRLPRRFDLEASRLVASLRRQLQRLLAQPGDSGDESWRATMARKVLHLSLHPGAAEASETHAPVGLLDVLNLGHAVAELQALRLRAGLTPELAAELDGVLVLLARAVEAPEAGAQALHQRATQLVDPAARRAAKDAVDALTGAAPLLKGGA